MRYLQRDDTGNVIGHFANEQKYASECVPDDHPDLLAWNEAKKERAAKRSTLEDRVRAIETHLGLNK